MSEQEYTWMDTLCHTTIIVHGFCYLGVISEYITKLVNSISQWAI